MDTEIARLIEECASLREWSEGLFFVVRSILLADEAGDEKAMKGALAHAREVMGRGASTGQYGPQGYSPQRRAS